MKLFGLELTRSAGSTAGLSPIGYANKGAWWPLIREPVSGAWQRNKEWSTDTVLAHHAVYACITRIAQDIGKLRPQLMEQDADGIWKVVSNTAHSPVIRTPNRFQNHIQFKEWWATSKLVHGNTYVLLERDNRGVVVAMYVLDPTRVQVLVAPDGEVFYNIHRDILSGLQDDAVAVPASEIIHDRINCLFHPLVGTSPIFACGTAANMGLQIQTNSSAFFGNGSNPSGVMVSPTPITPEKALEMSDLWNAQFGKERSGGVAVLGGGLTFTQMRMSAVDSQLIEQLKWTAETVCSTFHVPSWKIGVGPMPAYTKTEFANQAYYSDCLQSPIEQWELCMDEALGFDTPTDGRYLGVELDLDGLLRMDAASQITTLKEAVGGSILTVNEARAKVDQPPVPGGDSIWMQQQNYSLEALQKRDAKADPFATGAAATAGVATGTPPAPNPDTTTTVPDPGTTDATRMADIVDQEAERGASFGFLVRDCMEKGFAVIAATVDAQRTELGALRTEMQTRALPAPEPAPVVTELVADSDSDSVEMWDGWFARDALAMVRDAQATQGRVVDDIESQRFDEFSASTRAAIDTLTATVHTLAARETVVNVAAPVVNVAPAAVHMTQPPIEVTVTVPAAPATTVTRTSKVVRGAVGELDSVVTTEVKE